MKAASSALDTHLQGEVTSLATCWRVTRTDGVEVFLTDHDQDLLFEGNLYVAESGYSRTAVQNDSTLSVDNLEIEGFLDSSLITEADLRAGLYDFAEIRVFMVNWQDLGQGELKLRRGRLGEVTLVEGSEIYRAELRGMSQSLSQQIGQVYSPECRVDLGDSKCKIPIQPPVVERSTEYQVGDFYRVVTDEAASNQAQFENRIYRVTQAGTTAADTDGVETQVGINNASFEQDGTGSSVSVTGWTIVSGEWDLHDSSNGGLGAQDGSIYLEGGVSASGEIKQEILVEDNFNLTAVDSGDVDMDFSIWRANSFGDDEGRVLVEILDGTDTVIATPLDTGLEEITPEDTWVERSFSDFNLPTGSRKIRITLFHNLVTGSQANAAFDNVTAVLKKGPLEYSTTVGDTTLDGTVLAETQQAWTRHATVTNAIDRKTFEIDVTEARAVDDWFNVGAATFESGLNQGRSMEIKDWIAADSRVVLYLALPNDIQVGDELRLYPGCDKTLATCRDKFDNVINFRGEPFVPGSDFLARYPDQK